jgi:putative flippase GtrA
LVAFAGNGAINTLLSWLVYLALLRLAFGVPLSYSASFAFGIVLSALLNMRLAFGVRHSVGNVARYALAYAVMYLVGLSLVTLLVRLGIPAPWAPILATPLMVPLSFLVIQRTLAFRGYS